MNRVWSSGSRRKRYHGRQAARILFTTATPFAAWALFALSVLWSVAVTAEDNRQDAEVTHPEDCGAFPLLDWTTETDTGDTAPRSERCRGSYLDPLEGEDTSRDPAGENIEAYADRSELEGDIVRFYGDVEARQGYRVLRASEGEFNTETRIGDLLGDVELREPGLLLRGATGTIDANSGEATLTAGQMVLHRQHIRGSADLMERRGDGNIDLDDATYTYCPPQQDTWELKAETVHLNLDEGVGIARDAKIEMGGVPVLYTPYLEFPLDDRRKSGFLWADIGDDSRGGLDLATPYYFNLAPNYDATFTPRYIDERGLLTELEFRYLSRAIGYWELSGAGIKGDDEYQIDRPDRDGDRWLTAIDQSGLFGQRWRTRIDYTNTSDNDYFSDIDTTSLDVRQATELLQLAQMDYLGDNWLATLQFQDFKKISRDILRDPHAKLPQLTLTRTAAYENFAPNLIWVSDYGHFNHTRLAEGQRLYNEVGANYTMEWIWGFLTPTVKYRQLNYDLDEETIFRGELNDTPDVGAPMVSLDGGLFFERYTSWGLQTLEPRVYYLWSEYEDQSGLPLFDTSVLTFSYDQLFRDTKYAGNDRLDDANQVSVGLTTRFIDRHSGRENLVASIGQILYFDDREVAPTGGDPTRDTSLLAAQFGLALADNWDFRSEWLWNTRGNDLDQTSVQFRWHGKGESVFNLGYSYRRNRSTVNFGRDTNQVDVSSYIPVSRDWRIFFSALYSIENKDRLNDLVGVEYNSCCWRVRLAYQRFVDQNTRLNNPELVEGENAIYFQFELKGLGGVGSTIVDVMEENIRGYRDSEI